MQGIPAAEGCTLATQTKDGKVPPRGLACGPIIPLTLQCLTNVAMGYLLIFKQDDLGDTLSGKDGRTASLFACQRDSFPFRFVSFRFVRTHFHAEGF